MRQGPREHAGYGTYYLPGAPSSGTYGNFVPNLTSTGATMARERWEGHGPRARAGDGNYIVIIYLRFVMHRSPE